MSTVTQNEANDYDIDVAIIFDKDNLNELGSIAAKNIIVDALNRKCTNFKTPPEAKLIVSGLYMLITTMLILLYTEEKKKTMEVIHINMLVVYGEIETQGQ